MGISTKEAWKADAAGTLLLFEPERLTLVTDPAHPLYDPRVHLPIDDAMVASIMAKGVFQPISAVRDASTGQVLVAAGRQRVKNAIEANRRLVARGDKPLRVPVVPRNDTLSGAMVVSASENAIRRPDTPIERATKMSAMLARGHDMAGVAEAFGCSEATVQSTVALLDAHPDVQAAVAAGDVGSTHATKLLKLPAQEQAQAVASVIAAGKGETGHAKARAQRKAVAEAAGGKVAPKVRTAKEIRAAMQGAAGPVRAALAWVLGESDDLSAEPSTSAEHEREAEAVAG